MKNKNWNPNLSPEQNYILKHEGTEPAGSSILNYGKREGDISVLDVELHYFHQKLNTKVVPVGHLFISHYLMFLRLKLIIILVILAQSML